MIDPTRLTMGLTVEELEKLMALELHNQFCEVLSLANGKVPQGDHLPPPPPTTDKDTQSNQADA